MTFRYTDPDGDHLHVEPFLTRDGSNITLSVSTNPLGTAVVRIPIDRVEELIAGIRDTARQATGGTT